MAMVDDGHGREGHPLNSLVYERITDSQGNVEGRLGGEVVAGGLSRPGEIGFQQGEAAEIADRQEDFDEYQQNLYHPDRDAAHEELLRRAAENDDEDQKQLINSSYRAYNTALKAVHESMIQGNDHGRSGELSRLREALQEERAENPGRQTPRDKAIVDRISDLTTKGIY